jgi:hypothetical protein
MEKVARHGHPLFVADFVKRDVNVNSHPAFNVYEIPEI